MNFKSVFYLTHKEEIDKLMGLNEPITYFLKIDDELRYKEIILDLKNNVKNEMEVYLEFSFRNFLLKKDYPKENLMITHEDQVVEKWPCFNNPKLDDDLKETISNLDLTNINGIIFSEFRYPTLQNESDGITCFCIHCQKKSRSPDAAEDVKIRDINDKRGNQININEVKKHLMTISRRKLSYKTLIKDKKLKKWYQFRCNSLTKFMGSLLIHFRSLNQNLKVGMMLDDLKSSLKVGQIYEDLATYQDFISSNILIGSKIKIDSSTIKQINKKLKKSEGEVEFVPYINLKKDTQIKDLNIIRNTLKYFNVNSAIFKLNSD